MKLLLHTISLYSISLQFELRLFTCSAEYVSLSTVSIFLSSAPYSVASMPKHDDSGVGYLGQPSQVVCKLQQCLLLQALDSKSICQEDLLRKFRMDLFADFFLLWRLCILVLVNLRAPAVVRLDWAM